MLLTEKLLENAKAAIDEARQHADEINRLTQRVQELEQNLNEMAIGKAEEAAKRQQLEQSLNEMASGKAEEAAKCLQLEEVLQHLRAENTSLADTLAQETSHATSLQHEVDRLRQKLVGPKTDEGNAVPHSDERVAKLELEVDKLRRSLENLWRIESRQDIGRDEEDQRPNRWVTWQSMAWLCATALAGWLAAVYLGLTK